ncbi:hypothetical protein LUZ63_000303 [Rhynchospora breviuscula]|uniref:RRM domain-containing protein n=1 Tax=Rhynchospora breviuscula TaxID=2022672 RepID=A0A9Q0CUP2_9POAL|nr:hypothetical protein LUZ63_000303 [Rhynchospora breviuscula]
MTTSIRSIQWIEDIQFCCAMALPLFRVASSLFRASIKPPLLRSTASTSTLSAHFLNPCTNPNSKFLHLIKTSLSTSVAEVEAAPTAIQKEELLKNRLIAQNIPWDTTVDEIRALFEKHGTVVDIQVSMYNKRKNRGLAFITMTSEEEALTALSNLNKTEFGGRKIGVDFSRSQKKEPQPPQGPKKKYSVFVGNLSFKVRSQDLKEFFQKDASVVTAKVIYNSKPTRRSAGYGFITFYSKEEAEVAIETFNGKELMGRPVRMGYAKDISPEQTAKEISTEEVAGDSTQNSTTSSQENTENNTSVEEEKTANV